MSKTCQVCGGGRVDTILDIGEHPIASHFLRTPDERQKVYRLALGQCSDCGTVQLLDPLPARDLISHFNWSTYREPEQHLDELVEILAGLQGISSSSCIAGVSVKDDTTLDRFRRRGFGNIWRLNPKVDLGIDEPTAGPESVQNKLKPELASAAAHRHGTADLLIVRQVMEHADDLTRFIAGMSALLSPTGYVLVEAPDTERNLMLRDYTAIWEEHVLYFTLTTLTFALRKNRLEPVRSFRFPYPYEDSLCIIARRAMADAASVPIGLVEEEIATAVAYGRDFSAVRRTVQNSLTSWRREKGKIALYGAGHLSCAFINYFGLADLIEFVVDDSLNKQGLLMPGSKRPIVAPGRLLSDGITLCLFGLAPENEDKIVDRNESFIAGGGTFGSILRGSKRGFVFLD